MTVVAVQHPHATGGLGTHIEESRRLDIQGLRAVAVLMVVAGHAGLPFPGGFVGVDVFLVISGFVITSMLHREWLATGRLRVARFFVRRFKRLAPPLAAVLVATLVAAALFLPTGPAVTITTAAGSLSMMANVVIAHTVGGYFDAPARMNPLLHIWSLSTEEQFYLVFPLVLVLGWRLSQRAPGDRRWPLLLVAAVTVVSATFALDLTGIRAAGDVSFWYGYYSPLTRAWEFAVGSLIVLWPKRLKLRPAVSAALSVVGVVGLAGSMWLITAATSFPGPWTVLPVVATMLLLVGGAGDSGRVQQLLSSRPMVAVGDWSYSLYLWHWPFIVVAAVLWPGNITAAVIAAALSVAPAAAAHRWIERPLRAMTTVPDRGLIMLFAGTMVPPLVISGLVGFAAGQGYWSAQAATAGRQAEARHLGQISGCFAEGAPTLRPEDCLIVTGVSGPPVYLLGDSSADQFTEALVGATRSLGRSLTSYSSSGCTFADVTVSQADGTPWRPGCPVYKAETMAWLKRAAPGVVVLSNTDHYLIDPAFALARQGATSTVDTAEKANVYRTGLRDQVQAIRALGHEVILVNTIPDYQPYMTGVPLKGWRDPAHCPALVAWTGTCADTTNTPLADFARQQDVVWNAIAQAALDTGSRSVNLNGLICPDGCQVWRGGSLIYRDSKHLSVGASRDLASAFTAVLGQT